MKKHQHHGYKGKLKKGGYTTIDESVSMDLTGSVTIGQYVTITEGVKILTHRHHWNHSRDLRKKIDAVEPVDLYIGKDVFIGQNTIINAVSYIGDGAVIGTGSVLTKSVPDYEVWAGNPAKKVNERNWSEEDVILEEFPPTSVYCITYMRTDFLPGIVDMFLKQDYKGEKELVIVNDDPDVKIVCKNDDVNIHNFPKRYENVRDKQNQCYKLCKHDVIMPWADDDLYAPWAISTAVRYLGVDDFVALAGFYKHSKKGKTFHNQTISGLYAIRKKAWRMIGGTPVWIPEFAKLGIKKVSHETHLIDRVKEAGLYKEAALKKDEVYFTWRHLIADHSIWKDEDPKKFIEDPKRKPKTVDITV